MDQKIGDIVTVNHLAYEIKAVEYATNRNNKKTFLLKREFDNSDWWVIANRINRFSRLHRIPNVQFSHLDDNEMTNPRYVFDRGM